MLRFVKLSLFLLALLGTIHIQAEPIGSQNRIVLKYESNNEGRGEISPQTGRPKTVRVRPYHRKDGTPVRGHYRSPPRRRP